MSRIVDDLRNNPSQLGDEAADEIESLERAYALLFQENGTLKSKVDELAARVGELEKDAELLRYAMKPSRWTKEQSDAWHKNIPDVHAAFAALLATTIDAARSKP